MGKSVDALKKILDYTKKLGENIKKIVPTIKQATEELHKAKNIVAVVDRLVKEVKALEQGLVTVKNVTKALSFVPIIGAVCTQFSNICDSANKILKGFDKPIGSIRTGLSSVDKTVTKVNTSVEKFYQKLVLTQERLETYNESGKVMVSFVEIAEEFGTAEDIIKKLDAKVELVEDCLTDINDQLVHLKENLFKNFQTVVATVNSIEEKFSPILKVFDEISKIVVPIGKAFDTILNVIKPLKWVLDAVSFLFNRILKPVIDKVLEVTGILSLIHKLEDKIMSELGIDKLKQEVEAIIEKDICKPLNEMEEFLEEKMQSVETLLVDLNDLLSSNAFESLVDKYVDEYIEKIYYNHDPEEPIVLLASQHHEQYRPMFREKNKEILLKKTQLLSEVLCMEENFASESIAQMSVYLQDIHRGAEQLQDEIEVIRTYRLENELLIELFEVILEYIDIIDTSIQLDEVHTLLGQVKDVLDHGLGQMKELESVIDDLELYIQQLETIVVEKTGALPSRDNLLLLDSIYSNVTEMSNCSEKYLDVFRDIGVDKYEKLQKDEVQYKTDLLGVSIFVESEFKKLEEVLRCYRECLSICIANVEITNRRSGLYSEQMWDCSTTLHEYIVKFHNITEPVSVVFRAACKALEKQKQVYYQLIIGKIQQYAKVLSSEVLKDILSSLMDCFVNEELKECVNELKKNVSALSESILKDELGLHLSNIVITINQRVDGVNQESLFLKDICNMAEEKKEISYLAELIEAIMDYENGQSITPLILEREVMYFESFINVASSMKDETLMKSLNECRVIWEKILDKAKGEGVINASILGDVQIEDFNNLFTDVKDELTVSTVMKYNMFIYTEIVNKTRAIN